MTVAEYINKVDARYRSGISTEHSYRSDLLGLIESLVPGITITNEPKRVACGAPDYIITRRNIPVGYIEAKDIGADLNSKTYKEQFDRYRQSLDNLIITDYLTFQFFVYGSHTTTVTIGEITGNKIHPITDNFERFIDLITNFCEYAGQTIKSAQKLSKMMAAKAKLLANVIELALDPEKEIDGVNELQNINLLSQYESFKQVLIHDITPKAFADIYAQTIAYGMFAARLNDPSLENFTRQEAAELIPKSNPFLRKLFQYIAGYDLDDRIVWIVDALADIFRATNVEEMLKDFGKATHQTDPFIHFYETFLSEYDPKLRKSRGVWYTPEPVVNFIVRSVDDILKTEFGLTQGLADTSMIKIKIPGQDKKPSEKEVHKVQILDPAAGTGTFLAEVIKHIHRKFIGQQGIWSQYAEDHLIPRINGFEILMASYAMAHLKLEMLLRDTGYKPIKDQRLKVYLTNSLEEHHPYTGTLFANWLSTEAHEANHVKRDTPVMVVLGNPPYSVSSKNKGEWIENLMLEYKKGLDERNINPLSDDYIKFIRLAQEYIFKTGEGIVGFITNNSFIDGIIHRQMRRSLIGHFNKIFIINLHGNSKKKEVSPNGCKDENVFDIQQGVSIILLIKLSHNFKRNTEVYQWDCFGVRQVKYQFLFENSISTIKWNRVNYKEPNYLFTEIDNGLEREYKEFVSIKQLFKIGATGVKTERDNLTIQFDKDRVLTIYQDFKSLTIDDLRIKYNIQKEGRDWKLVTAKADIVSQKGKLAKILYRPFDIRYTIYSGRTKGFLSYPRFEVFRNIIGESNIGLIVTRLNRGVSDGYFLVSNQICDLHVLDSAADSMVFFPLYVVCGDPNLGINTGSIRDKKPNLDEEIVRTFSDKLCLQFTTEPVDSEGTFSPQDVLNFVYSVLHSVSFRQKYKAFLKVDFPRIPYPKDKITFWQMVKLGRRLQEVHLLDCPDLEILGTEYPIYGSNEVHKIKYEGGKVWINDFQYFNGVPKLAWEFYIGGYQPAQKWLKDRKGRILSFDDIMHYQKIIVALTETDRIMKEIDKIDFLP